MEAALLRRRKRYGGMTKIDRGFLASLDPETAAEFTRTCHLYDELAVAAQRMTTSLDYSEAMRYATFIRNKVVEFADRWYRYKCALAWWIQRNPPEPIRLDDIAPLAPFPGTMVDVAFHWPDETPLPAPGERGKGEG